MDNWVIKCHKEFESMAGLDYHYWFGAGVAQLVEQLICNQPVGGSTPFTSSNFFK